MAQDRNARRAGAAAAGVAEVRQAMENTFGTQARAQVGSVKNAFTAAALQFAKRRMYARWWRPPHTPGVGPAWAGGEDTYLGRISYV